MPPKNPKYHNRKKTRKQNHLEEIPYKFYIFCEGEKTEPNYFKGFKEYIQNNPIYDSLVHIHIDGVGKETLRIIRSAEEYILKNKIKKAQVWCVYDKDSFPEQDFNAVFERACSLNKSQKEVEYHVAWSNQCIEYWFMLHFAWYPSNNDRKFYIDFLNKEFKNKNIGKYKKNNERIFDILCQQGDPKEAIKRAKRRLEECEHLSDSCSAPATKVHLLVSELAKFLPKEIQNKFI